MGEMVGHRLDRDQIGFFAELAGRLDHLLRQPGVLSTSSSGSTTANGSLPTMSRAHHTAWPRPSGACWRVKLMAPASGWSLRQNVLLGLLAARGQRGVELEHAVEMILDHALVAAGDEDEMLDAGFPAPRRPTYWISGLSTMVSISFGIALVAGRTRVPRPATGNTALRIFMGVSECLEGAWNRQQWHVGSRFAAANKGGCVGLPLTS